MFAVLVGFCGCSFAVEEPDGSAFDRNAPRVDIVSPERGTVAGDVTQVRVSGTASDDSGVVASVTVNGVPATLAADGTWFADVVVAPGTTLLRAIALDAEANRSERTRAVVAGPMVSLDRHIEDGIRGTVSAQALTTLGYDTADFIEAGGLMTAVQGMNPVVAAGGGPDCLYGQASITSLSVGDAEVRMEPTNGGVLVSAVLDDVRVGMHLQWAVSCLEGSRDVMLAAERVTVQGLLTVGVVDRNLDIRFENPNAQITGFDPQLPGVPDVIVQLLGLDAALSPVLRSVTERFVVPIVSRTLSPLDDTRTIDVAGVQVDVEVEPTQVSFGPHGGTLALDTSLRARGDTGELVFVPSTVPALEVKHGFELAVADDAANQLLTSLWSANAFNTTLDLEASAHEQIGKLYDSVRLQLMVPPHLSASVRPLELTFGDWIATFKYRGIVAATVVIHAKTALYVDDDGSGKLRMHASAPAVFVDLADDGDRITKVQYDAIKAFAAEQVIARGSAAVSAIPLPTIGHATATNLWVEQDRGYLFVTGDIR